MKVLHVIPSLAIADGGPSRAVVGMVRALLRLGVEAHIATTDAGIDVPTGVFVEHEGCQVIFFPLQIRSYKVSLPLLAWLRKHARDYDLAHVHTLFSFAPWAAAKAFYAAGVPYVIRPLGVLNYWGMEQRRPWLKKLSFSLIERKMLGNAAVIHYTAKAEAGEAARLHLPTRSEVIPLGVDLELFRVMPSCGGFLKKHPRLAGRRIVLFLSRIDAKKGLEILLHAFAHVRSHMPAAILVIAGSGDASLQRQLLELADTLGIQDDVLWTGFLDVAERQLALAAAELFVLPSRSENFGIALLEAMASGLPCVSTAGVALAVEAGAAVRVVPITPDAIAGAILQLLQHPDEALAIGRLARKTAFQCYSLRTTAEHLVELYGQLMPPSKNPH